jgi:hypothetical protein
VDGSLTLRVLGFVVFEESTGSKIGGAASSLLSFVFFEGLGSKIGGASCLRFSPVAVCMKKGRNS